MRGFDGAGAGELRAFFYLPFEHSEDLADQERGITLYKAAGDADGLKWAELHADIIRRFGRFPHRNAVLGRATTPAGAGLPRRRRFRRLNGCHGMTWRPANLATGVSATPIFCKASRRPIAAGEAVAVLGASGSGKTTLLRASRRA